VDLLDTDARSTLPRGAAFIQAFLGFYDTGLARLDWLLVIKNV
jgi:hypothetical protein